MGKRQYPLGGYALRFFLGIIGILFVSACTLPALAKQPAEAAQAVWQTLTKRAISEVWQQLGGIPEREDAIAVTNAGYAVIGGHTTAPCLDLLHTWTGASLGKGTLVELHRARTAPLWFFLYDRETGWGAYCEVNSAVLEELLSDGLRPRQIRREMAGMRSDDLFTKIGAAQIDYEYLLEDDNHYAALASGMLFNGNEFSIVGIVNGIVCGMPNELLQSIKFHDHYCPGVTSGYFIADYVEKNLPGDRYFYFSVPNWCKDDAIQVILNTTPGKSGYAVTYLNNDDKAALKEEYKSVAGIMCVQKDGRWTAHVLGFDFDKVRKEIGIDRLSRYPTFNKILMDIEMLNMAPEDFVEVLKVIRLSDDKQPSDYARPGINLLEVAGLAAE